MSNDPRPVLLITGPSGAGRTTATSVLEDLGFEAIGNIPLSLVPLLLESAARPTPLALGLDVRNRDFSVSALLDLRRALTARDDLKPELLYLDCSADVLLRRYSETRRRHPLSPDVGPSEGVSEELGLLDPLRAAADQIIDTSELSPHDLRDRLRSLYDLREAQGLSVTVQSFSYRRGLPQGADMVLDCRFLANPHWEPELRPRTGQDPDVAAFIARDPRAPAFTDQVRALLMLVLPAHRDEGRAHFTLALGCTGGRHRSVAMAEKLGSGLAEGGWRVSIRHRELEGRATPGVGTPETAGDRQA